MIKNMTKRGENDITGRWNEKNQRQKKMKIHRIRKNVHYE